MISSARPPARNRKQYRTTSIFGFLGLLTLLSSLPWLASCTGVSSAASGNPSAQITLSGNMPSAQKGVAWSATITASGGTAPYTFSLASGSLPPGLSLGQSSGSIAGTPTQTGTFVFGIQAVDSTGLKGAANFQITVSSSGGVSVTVTPASAIVPSGGTAQFTAVVSNTSNTAVTWSASLGTISSGGLYQAPAVTATANATVTATSQADPTQSANAQVQITTGQPALTITTTSLAGATSGAAYSATLQATGGTTPYSWAISSGALPSGISLHADGSVSGTTTQIGLFTFTAQVKDSSVVQQTATQSLTLTVSTSTGGGNTIPLSFFGADFNTGKIWPGTDGQNKVATLGGIRLWDDAVKWGQINTADGVYNWTELDGWLDKAQTYGLDVLYTFGDTPQFAAPTTAPGPCLSPGPYSCASPTDVNVDGTGTDAYFQAFVTALVTHAAGRISYYELWNEPDYNGFWSGNTAQLVRMGKDAAAIIRSLDPNARILSPSAHGPTMATWFDGYVAAGGAPNFDIVNVHMRGAGSTNADPEEFLTVYGQVQTELKARQLTSLPLWDDEHGILVGQLTDPDMLAGYAARSVILRAGVSLQRQYIYTWDTPSTAYGLQGNSAGTAWDQVAGWLIGHSISPCVAQGTVYTCQLDYGEIVWDTAQSCSNGVCTTSSYAFPSQYLWYHDIEGNRVALSGTTVQIGYKPILLENQ